jgi:putative transposase
MPRANRHYAPGYVWHITHRCHKREFLLKFSRDREAFRGWLFEARKRFGLCVLNYMITHNHIHLLVVDTEENVISKSIQLIAGRTGQDYNERKRRSGAFWEDRYHATAIDTQNYLWQCMLYIDCNMVRAGVVRHPSEWTDCGYNEIVEPVSRYRVIDNDKVVSYFCFQKQENFLAEYRKLVDSAAMKSQIRDSRWSEAIAIGNRAFLEEIRNNLGIKAKDRTIEEDSGVSCLKESPIPYEGVFGAENSALRGKNGYYWI